MSHEDGGSERGFPELKKGRVETLAYGGWGIVKPEGEPICFIPRTCPSELIEYQVVKQTRKYHFGKVNRVIEASEHRVKAQCRHFDQCGACHYQHLKSEYALEQKELQVLELIQKATQTDSLPEIRSFQSNLTYGYRNKIELSLDEQGRICLSAMDNHLFVLNECLIVSEPIQQCLPHLKALSHAFRAAKLFRISIRHSSTGDIGLVLHTRKGTLRSIKLLAKQLEERIKMRPLSIYWTDPQLKKSPRHIAGAKFLVEWMGSLSFQAYPDSFFQTNPQVYPILADRVVSHLAGLNISHVLDLYCGAGFFSLALAKKGVFCLGVEGASSSIDLAIKNAFNNGLEDLTKFICQDIEKMSPSDWQALNFAHFPQTKAILIDPPRRGLDQLALGQIIALESDHIVYVSCDPATLARDLTTFTQGGYTLTHIELFDMFPQTYHIESLVVLSRDTNS